MISSVSLTPPEVADSVTFCVAFTVDAVTVKAAEVAPAATVTDAGTFSRLLLLASETFFWLAATSLR